MSTIKADITRELLQAFAEDLQEVAIPFTLTSIRTAPASSPFAPVHTSNTSADVKYGVFLGYDNREVDGARILATDVKLLVLQDSMPPRPRKGDTVAQVDMGTFTVQSVTQDAARATWVCQLRGV